MSGRGSEESKTVLFEIRDQIGIITLNRPEKRNAIDPRMTIALEAVIDRIESDPGIRVGILRANIAKGRPVFCAGHDLTHFRETFGTPEEDAVTTASGGFAGFTRKLRRKPLIAAVDGLATSGGCEMVLACDIVLASRRASFALAEVKWNLVPTAGGAFRLPRALGRYVAMDALLTAEPISALRAYQLGLVSRLTSSAHLNVAAAQVATKIAANADRGTSGSRNSQPGRRSDGCGGLESPRLRRSSSQKLARPARRLDFVLGKAVAAVDRGVT